jgi:PKD repeat protein
LASISGCDSIVVTQLTVSPLPQVNLTVIDANCLNTGGSVTTLITQGTAPFNYSWSNGQTSATINNVAAGIYGVTVTDANTCIGTGTALVNTITPSSSIVGFVKLNGAPVTTGVAKLYRKKNQQAYPLYAVAQLNSNGFFQFDNLPNDTFIVGGTPNPASYPNTGTTYNGNGHKWELATVTITGCSTIDTLNISSFTPVTQKGNGKITGRIIDISDTSAQRQPGEPIKGAGVTLQKKPGGNPLLRVFSDSTGTYSMDSVAVGNYDLYVDVPGCGMFNSYVIPVTVTDNFFEERNFYVDSIEGFIDTIDYEIAFLPCNYIPVFNVMSYCAGDQITFQNSSIGTDTSLIYSWDFNNDGVVDLTNTGTANYTINTPGNYTARLELIDLVNGCSKSYTRSYEIKPLPILLLDTQVVFCKGEEASLLVTGANNYLWQSSPYLSANTSNSPQLSTAVPYSQWFSVRGETNGCYSYDSVFVEVLNAPAVNFSTNPQSICQFNTVTFINQTQASGFNPVYQWDFNGDGISDDTSLTTASYTFQNYGNQNVTLSGLFSNGCVITKTIPVNVVQNTIQINAGYDRSMICGDKVIVQAYSNTSGLSWEWTPNYYIDNNFINTPVLTPDTTVQYVVKGSKQGCYSLDTIIVNVIPLSVNAGIDKDVVCSNTIPIVATSNGVNGTIYNWISGSNLSSQNSLNVTANPTQTQTYILKGIKNTCVAYDTVIVNVKPIPVNAGSDKTMICGQSTTLSANTSGVSGVAYNWEPATYALSPGSANTVVKPEQSTYFVVKGMVGSCIAFDTAFVQVNPFAVYAGQDQYLNCGDSKQLVASSYYSSGINVSWQPASIFNLPSKLNPVVKADSTTRAILQVNKDNCISTDTVMIYIKNEIPISFNADKTIFANKYPPYVVKFTNTTPNTSNLQFYWNFGDGTPLINAVNYTHTYNQTGNFDVSLMATSQSGACGDTLAYNEYIVTWTPTAIPSLLAADGVNIYPNPNDGKFIITLGRDIQADKAQLIDVSGKLIKDLSEQLKTSNSKAEVDLRELNLPNGVYMLEVSTKKGKVVERINIY